MEMIKMIGKAARNNYLVAFFNALNKENIKSEVSIENLKKFVLFSLETEEIIKKWESYLELPNMPKWSLQDRRERIIYTINSNQSCTEQFLKSQANIFTNGEIAIDQQFDLYNFIIRFTSMIGTPPNIDNFKEMVNVNKPAHLTYSIKYRYRTWEELKVKTWNSLKVNTWEEVRSKGVI